MQEDPAVFVAHLKELFDGSVMRELETKEKRRGDAD
jgi:hypothetical protein